MSPSLALSGQQHRVLQEYLSAYHVLSLTGNDGVDKWTEQRLWDAVLSNVRVVVGTPKVLEDALTHGFVRMSRLALLVFDEGRYAGMLSHEHSTESWKSAQMYQREPDEQHYAEVLPSQQVQRRSYTTHTRPFGEPCHVNQAGESPVSWLSL